MKDKIYFNAGVEWTGEVEANTKEEAEIKAQEICQSKLDRENLRDYNFDIDLELTT